MKIKKTNGALQRLEERTITGSSIVTPNTRYKKVYIRKKAGRTVPSILR